MSVPRFGLPAVTLEKICDVLARHSQVEKAVLYGSRAKGNYKNSSDIDLTLHGHDLCHGDLLKIMGELDDLLLPYTIDLSLFHMMDHAGLREHIQRMGQEIYSRTDAVKTRH